MGGDDLGSDDEYLSFDTSGASSSAYSTKSYGGDAIIDDGDENYYDDDDDDASSSSIVVPPSKKRKKGGGATADASAIASDEEGEEDYDNMHSSSRDKKDVRGDAPRDILLRAGRGIAMDTANAQSTFLSALYSRTMKLRCDGDDDDDDGGASFSFLPHLHDDSASDGKPTTTTKRQYVHSNLAAYLKSGPLTSNKRLKNWKHPHSPMILVITISARRSVELMKELSSLRLPVAKLFAKHIGVEEQVRLLSRGIGGRGGGNNNATTGNASGGGGGGKKRGGGSGGGGGGGGKYYSLAVGTPGRLLKLLRYGGGGRDDNGEGGGDKGEGGPADAVAGTMGALRLNHTEVVIVDCHEDSKGWNVCTLNDTSRELMDFMKEGVMPQMEKRRGKIKLAMF
jgi:hypothetical protein